MLMLGFWLKMSTGSRYTVIIDEPLHHRLSAERGLSLRNTLTRMFVRRADCVIALSMEMMETARRLGLPPEKIINFNEERAIDCRAEVSPEMAEQLENVLRLL